MNRLPIIALVALSLGCDIRAIDPPRRDTGDVTLDAARRHEAALADTMDMVVQDQASQIMALIAVSDSLNALVTQALARAEAARSPRDVLEAWVRLAVAHADHAESLQRQANLLRELWGKNTLAMLLMAGATIDSLPGVPTKRRWGS